MVHNGQLFLLNHIILDYHGGGDQPPKHSPSAASISLICVLIPKQLQDISYSQKGWTHTELKPAFPQSLVSVWLLETQIRFGPSSLRPSFRVNWPNQNSTFIVLICPLKQQEAFHQILHKNQNTLFASLYYSTKPVTRCGEGLVMLVLTNQTLMTINFCIGAQQLYI